MESLSCRAGARPTTLEEAVLDLRRRRLPCLEEPREPRECSEPASSSRRRRLFKETECSESESPPVVVLLGGGCRTILASPPAGVEKAACRPGVGLTLTGGIGVGGDAISQLATPTQH